MNKSNQNITFKGNPIEVSGTELKEGDSLPDFQVTGNDMSAVTANNFQGKVLVISSIPSVDTPVCAIETKKFNEEIGKIDGAACLTVSRDLPFAQKRWCAAEGVENLTTASDYKDRTFGTAFGTDLESLGILARAVFVVGTDGKIAHLEYVSEIAEEPNYDAVIDKVKEMAA